jgi:hypothetical protein
MATLHLAPSVCLLVVSAMQGYDRVLRLGPWVALLGGDGTLVVGVRQGLVMALVSGTVPPGVVGPCPLLFSSASWP